MNNKESIGCVTVAVGSGQQRKIEIEDFIRCDYPDERFISVAKLSDNEGYVINVENPENSGGSNQKMWLSETSFTGLFATVASYFIHNEINIKQEIIKMEKESITFTFNKR